MAETPPAPARPKRRYGAAALGALVPEAVAPALRQRGFASTTILTEWAEIVGPHLARWSNPVEIRWPRRVETPPETAPRALRGKEERASRATLVIASASAFALELQMASPTIIEAVNRRLGFGCIGGIEIRQAPRPAPPAPRASRKLDPGVIARLEGELARIEDPELRRAMAVLGAEIAARTRA